jgi:hypothetical protein
MVKVANVGPVCCTSLSMTRRGGQCLRIYYERDISWELLAVARYGSGTSYQGWVLIEVHSRLNCTQLSWKRPTRLPQPRSSSIANVPYVLEEAVPDDSYEGAVQVTQARGNTT